MTLDALEKGRCAIVKAVGGQGALRQHLLDMGVIPGARMEFVKSAPLGDPLEYRIHGYELTLRREDASQIEVEPIASDQAGHTSYFESDLSDDEAEHPGLGEGGRFHSRADENPLPDDTVLTFALAGNQNCGKTTLFNQLTGANQRVGNFPGVTVDRKEGVIKGHPNTSIVDLPGIYSMSPYSSEEVLSRAYILDEKPTGIINIVDATNIERNLYLTMQLMELNVPMVLALNMMDEVQSNGGSIRVNEMEAMLGIPVVPISAAHNEGVEELVDHALHVAHYQERPGRQDFCDVHDRGGAVHRCLHGIMHLIEDHAERAGIPVRFAATKLAEGDSRVAEALDLSRNETEMVEHIVGQMEEECGLDRAAAIADMRFSFIGKVVSRTVVKPQENKEHARSAAIDRLLTGRWTAIPVFVAIMAAIFILTFNVIGPFFQDLIQLGIDGVTSATAGALDAWGVSPVIESFILDGVFNGVGTVLLFFPIIVVMFFFLSLLQDTGYMARVAFFMDRSLRRIGLSGSSIVPMVMGFGCTVPAVMAARTLPSERDRKLTILLTPFMSCATKLTIYGFVAEAFFPRNAGWVMVGLYLLGILVAVVIGVVSHKSVFKGEAIPFVMELPNYRMPSAKSVGRLVWDKSKDFITRAFTVIFVATIIVWFLQSFSIRFELVEAADDSILAMLAGWLAPLFAPLGFGDWRFVTALIAGFMAKETVVSTLSVLFNGTGALVSALSPAAALSFLVFCLLYTPCVAAVAAIKRDLGGKWAVGIVVMQCAVAWVVAFAVYLIASLVI
ncbi:ferrous iron transporter FeoB [Slackia heliotrinireducens DSM 20476]|uniref:Ferrous iron transport protein B n=3 Tax=Slackia TaxID=84108 RepID=C7N6U6_SLAHD|nr:ferrous iron transporter FeoB [Slackia heliotrinireducens DSM 20476]